MPEKKKISAKEIGRDIRSGMSNADLMNKYGLSSKGLESVFLKLIESEMFQETELGARMPAGSADTADLEKMRIAPRCYPVAPMAVYDMEDLETEYEVADVTEKGVQLLGITVCVPDERVFCLRSDDPNPQTIISFKAVCRWVKEDKDPLCSRAGFEITEISDDDLKVLRSLIGTMSICDH